MTDDGVSRILDLVRTGRITPTQGVMLLELRHDLLVARRRVLRRKLFWYSVRDCFALGPLWRWIARRWG